LLCRHAPLPPELPDDLEGQRPWVLGVVIGVNDDHFITGGVTIHTMLPTGVASNEEAWLTAAASDYELLTTTPLQHLTCDHNNVATNSFATTLVENLRCPTLFCPSHHSVFACPGLG
jgi:hypothetical protein